MAVVSTFDTIQVGQASGGEHHTNKEDFAQVLVADGAALAVLQAAIGSGGPDTFATYDPATNEITFPGGQVVDFDAFLDNINATYDAAASTITLADGQAVDLSSFDSDTFATFDPATGVVTFPNGATATIQDTFASLDPATNEVTFADGQVVDLDTFLDNLNATYDTATTTITLADGQTVDLSSFDTDTDTFAAFNPATGVVTFANGATVTVQDTFGNIVDNLDGTATWTSADGSTTVTLLTAPGGGGTDTFATLDPATNEITFPSGQTVDLDTFLDNINATYDAATTTITLADGQTVDLSAFDTDTDTFATFDTATNQVTFPGGATATIQDTFSTFDQAANTITFADGQVLDLSTIGGTTDSVSSLALNASGQLIHNPGDGSAATTITLLSGQGGNAAQTDTNGALIVPPTCCPNGSSVSTVPNGSALSIACLIMADADARAKLGL